MRTKPTISEGQPREAGPHGITLQMRAIKRPEPVWLYQHMPAASSLSSPPPRVPYVKAEVSA